MSLLDVLLGTSVSEKGKGKASPASPRALELQTLCQKASPSPPASPQEPPSDEGRHAENLLLMLQFALDDICKYYPHDCVTDETWPLKWLGRAFPRQYERVTSEFPRRISRLMDERAPLGQFSDVLEEWVSLHVWMYKSFRVARNKHE
jgi:hypothetical protein